LLSENDLCINLFKVVTTPLKRGGKAFRQVCVKIIPNHSSEKKTKIGAQLKK